MQGVSCAAKLAMWSFGCCSISTCEDVLDAFLHLPVYSQSQQLYMLSQAQNSPSGSSSPTLFLYIFKTTNSEYE